MPTKLIKVEAELNPFEAEYLADTLKRNITEYRELAALQNAAGKISEAELEWKQSHSDFIEGVAKKLFPDWNQ